MAIAVIVQSGEHHAAAGAATGGGGESVAEERAVGRESIDVRRHRRHIAIATHRGAKVIGNDDDDVFFRGRSRRDQQAQGGQHGSDSF